MKHAPGLDVMNGADEILSVGIDVSVFVGSPIPDLQDLKSRVFGCHFTR